MDEFKSFCHFTTHLEDFAIAMQMFSLAHRPVRLGKICTLYFLLSVSSFTIDQEATSHKTRPLGLSVHSLKSYFTCFFTFLLSRRGKGVGFDDVPGSQDEGEMTSLAFLMCLSQM